MSETDGSQGTGRSSPWGRVEVQPGHGVVHRGADVLLVVPTVDAGVAERTAELLRVCEEPDPGGSRRVRRLAWMITDAETDQMPSFAFVLAMGGTVRLMVHGDLAVTVEGETPLSFNGTESLAWVERTVPATFDVLTIARPTDTPAPHALPGILDLEAGTVPGQGVTVRPVVPRTAIAGAEERADEPAGAAAAATHASAEAPGEAPARLLSRPVPAPTGAAPPQRPATARVEGATVIRASAGVRHVALSGSDPERARPRRAPLPIGVPASPSAAQRLAEVVRVRGRVCTCGQFNDPEVDSCSACGARLDSGGRLETRPRPPLGILITDDGRVCTVTGNLVIGREPEQAPDVRAKRARPLVLQDAEHSTSRVHAHLRLSEWKVLLSDGGSSNGTFISRAGPGGPWTTVPREPGTPLVPGDRVRLGKRELLFDRYHEPL